MYYYSEYESPIGTLNLASDGLVVCGFWLDGQKYHGDTVPEEMARKMWLLEHEGVDMGCLYIPKRGTAL